MYVQCVENRVERWVIISAMKYSILLNEMAFSKASVQYVVQILKVSVQMDNRIQDIKLTRSK